MIKTINFQFGGTNIKLKNIDPSQPLVPINKDWDELQQELYDQIDDSKSFSAEELETIANLSTKDFLKCLRDDDENATCYNRARAVYEYKSELKYAIKNHLQTDHWSKGLDRLRNGAIAADWNY